MSKERHEERLLPDSLAAPVALPSTNRYVLQSVASSDFKIHFDEARGFGFRPPTPRPASLPTQPRKMPSFFGASQIDRTDLSSRVDELLEQSFLERRGPTE